MRCYLLSSYQPDGLRIAAVHSLLFHGKLMRGPKKKILGTQTPFLGVQDVLRADLQLNCYSLSEILSPHGLSFVVSRRLAKQITSALPNTDYLLSHISKVVNVPYELGNMALAEKLRTAEIENRWWDNLPHEPEIAAGIDGYGELRMLRYQDLNEFGGKRAKAFTTYPGDDMFGPFQAELSDELLSYYPIIWHLCGLVLSVRAMEVLSSALNSDFFWWEEIEF